MIERLNTLFFSPTGTTSKICKQIAKAIDIPTTHYDISLKKLRAEYQDLSFNSDELVIIGVPVYSGRIPAFLEEYFSGFKGKNTPAVFVVLYGNRDYDDALLELQEIFEKRGFKGIAAGAFIGEHSYSSKVATNRPDMEDLNLALNFGKDIKQKLSDLSKLNTSQLEVKGNDPYKERIAVPLMSPETTEDCKACGICAEICPTEAISFTDFKTIKVEDCIRCNSCVKNCPEEAKIFTHELIISITQKLISNFSLQRKEAELFL